LAFISPFPVFFPVLLARGPPLGQGGRPFFFVASRFTALVRYAHVRLFFTRDVSFGLADFFPLPPSCDSFWMAQFFLQSGSAGGVMFGLRLVVSFFAFARFAGCLPLTCAHSAFLSSPLFCKPRRRTFPPFFLQTGSGQRRESFSRAKPRGCSLCPYFLFPPPSFPLCRLRFFNEELDFFF